MPFSLELDAAMESHVPGRLAWNRRSEVGHMSTDHGLEPRKAHRSMPRAPAGWYPDPEHPGRLRYWDGDMWFRSSPANPGRDGLAPQHDLPTWAIVLIALIALALIGLLCLATLAGALGGLNQSL